MEIRVTETMNGHDLRAHILERWGSQEALEQEAQRGDAEAQDDLFMLERLDEDPHRLEVEHSRTTVTTVSTGSLARLTKKRLALLDHVQASKAPLNVSQLARRVDRDKKNVSEDLALLETLGLIERVQQGREKTVRTRGTQIQIDLEQPATTPSTKHMDR